MIAFLPSRRECVARTLDGSGLASLLRHCNRWQGLLILNYHRIGEPAQSPFDRALFSATPEQFEAQVAWLTHHFDVIGADDLENVLSQRRGRFVMLTFDDGYRDNYETAFPILRRHGITATFFLATGFLDQPRLPWWDEIAWMVRRTRRWSVDLSAWGTDAVAVDDPDRTECIHRLLTTYKRLSGDRSEAFLDFLADVLETGRAPQHRAEKLWMTWNMVREMHAAGMHFGGHTVNHPVLANLNEPSQAAEIRGAKTRIEHELGTTIELFSYPVGKPETFTETTRRLLEQHGYRWAFSYHGGYVSFRAGSRDWDRWALPRVAVETDLSRAQFRSLLSVPQLFA